MRVRLLLTVVTLCALATFLPNDAAPRSDVLDKQKTTRPPRQKILTLTGEFVHNVGELQIHVANWGMFGSRPGTGATYSEAPSAQWPAGSGIEYLFGAGLWVGALRGGVPAVSTAFAPRFEFLPTLDPLDVIYRSAEGDRGGNRLPSPTADDDGDGEIDEDWRNGRDDDGDGEIDEDYAAVSKQMFSCWYTDDQTASFQIHPEHNPLHLLVRQESYQWEEDRFDDFVGINYWITNIGDAVLEDLYIGFFADCDAGSRTTDNYWDDDATGFLTNRAYCTDLGPVSLDIAYTYDADGDDGQTPGYFGAMFLGHTTDPTGEMAPKRVGITTYQNFSGDTPFDQGGDPTTDAERYELLSSVTPDRDAPVPRDYRMLMAVGPFNELLPGSTLVFQTAFVIGDGLTGPGSMEENGASAQLTYNGSWFNLDHDLTTGIAGRETPVFGPIDAVVIDSCNGSPVPIAWNSREALYINNDCADERRARQLCGLSRADSIKFMTGVAGNESQIHWIVGTAPPPPNMRVDAHTTGGVVVYWDNYSQTVPDVKTLEDDFESYVLWRADDWNRPIGTSERNGPEHRLWKQVFQADIVNGFGEDTGLDRYRYEPLTSLLSAEQKHDMIESIVEQLLEFPGEDPECPQGVTKEVCDTLDALARWKLGLGDGRQYYRYYDRNVHLGRPYFYSVTAADHATENHRLSAGKMGDPSSNFAYVEPSSRAQRDYEFSRNRVYVVPNPATPESMQPWTLSPNNSDPTGIKVEFRNLPEAQGVIRLYTLSGDLVIEIPFDGRRSGGSKKWDLVSRNGQDVASGVYLFSVDVEGSSFERTVGKFVVIR